jgi:hypothetical protein
MVPIYPATFEVVGAVAFALNAAAVVAVAIGAAAWVKDCVDAVVAEERRKDVIADYSDPDLPKLVADEEDIAGS